ncbi:sugar phosphate nucleotidyltransferase [Alphaproteobacteria bacterium]|nr:sugar phosphate nucleotidyltransferase [Alphaproteobacteria bacterium]
MDLDNFIVLADDPIAKVIDKMDLNLRSIVFVVGKKRNLVGAISGGDLRRYIKNKKRLSGLAKDAMNSSPLKMPSHVAPPVILELMKRNCISTIPLVDEFNRLVQIAKMEDLSATLEPTLPVFLFAGGKGERLGELTKYKPKPLMEIGGVTILDTVINFYSQNGVDNFFIAVRYLADQIEEHLKKYDHEDITIKVFTEKDFQGTAGALAFIKDELSTPIIVSNSDIIIDTDLKAFTNAFYVGGLDILICATEHSYTVPFGVIEKNGESVNGVIEKPELDCEVACGLYILSPSVLALLEPGEYLDMPDLINNAIKIGLRVGTYLHKGMWLDIGTPAQLEFARRSGF